ncbi:MAG: hypothetical protein JW820_00960, partial [Spirochaetales bacterium]|nr:hypothetical protein [Spirochaetales bacterium]
MQPNTDLGDLERVLAAARVLPPAESSYLEDDFVMNLMETVLDYQMPTKAVVRALAHYRDGSWDEVRTLGDLESLFDRFADDREGNLALAQ